MNDVNNRPLSPHLSIYRLHFNMILSILHRITGLMLIFGLLLFAGWIITAAAGREYFSAVQWFFGSWFGIFHLLGWSLTLFFHLCSGIRHLLWDIGYVIEAKYLKISGQILVLTVLVLVSLAWLVGIVTIII